MMHHSVNHTAHFRYQLTHHFNIRGSENARVENDGTEFDGPKMTDLGEA